MFVLKRANIACRQQITTVKLLQKHFKQLSYYTTSNWYYILVQLHYLSTNRGNFLKMQYSFYWCALLADLLWVIVGRAFTKNSRKARTWLFGASLWKIIEALWLVKYSSKFVFIDRRSWNSEYPGLWYGLVFELTS